MCVDYRKLNKITKRIRHPFPLIEDNIDRLHGQLFFTTLDFMSSYDQVPVEEGSREKTAFVTPDGHFQFKTVPFGICNASAKFTQIMNRVLCKLGFDVAVIDNIMIPPKTIEEGLARLKAVLEAVRETGFIFQLEKCHFLKKRVEHLGYQISRNGIKPGEQKINCITNFPEPTDVHKVK